MRCSRKKLKAKKAAAAEKAAKLKEEKEKRKGELDEAILNAGNLLASYIKDYGSYDYDTKNLPLYKLFEYFIFN